MEPLPRQKKPPRPVDPEQSLPPPPTLGGEHFWAAQATAPNPQSGLQRQGLSRARSRVPVGSQSGLSESRPTGSRGARG